MEKLDETNALINLGTFAPLDIERSLRRQLNDLGEKYEEYQIARDSNRKSKSSRHVSILVDYVQNTYKKTVPKDDESYISNGFIIEDWRHNLFSFIFALSWEIYGSISVINNLDKNSDLRWKLYRLGPKLRGNISWIEGFINLFNGLKHYTDWDIEELSNLNYKDNKTRDTLAKLGLIESTLTFDDSFYEKCFELFSLGDSSKVENIVDNWSREALFYLASFREDKKC